MTMWVSRALGGLQLDFTKREEILIRVGNTRSTDTEFLYMKEKGLGGFISRELGKAAAGNKFMAIENRSLEETSRKGETKAILAEFIQYDNHKSGLIWHCCKIAGGRRFLGQSRCDVASLE